MQKIFLYGPPGSGKTVVGKILSRNLDAGFIDVDSQIELDSGLTIANLISERGESAFRDIEQAAIERICCSESTDPLPHGWVVVALGGGALLREENRFRCEEAGEIVFLDVDISILLKRLSKQKGKRPLLTGDLEAKLKNLLDSRKAHYGSFELRVAINYNKNLSSNKKARRFTKTPGEIAWEIQQKLGCYHVTGMGSGYDVIVENNGLINIGKRLKERGLGGKVTLVCDENVDRFYSEIVLNSLRSQNYKVSKVVIKAGEEHKNLETVAFLWHEFLKAGLDRKSLVIAMGGGVLSDLAGFAASTFMRGCPWVVLPTSLLSMVDASLGGKTGFDQPEGKNLVGTFYPPRLVMADPDVLTSLPESELRSGLAEVVKHGIISDPDLYNICSRGFEYIQSNMSQIVRQAIGVKVQTIVKDPYEKGIRAALNLGHTVGHAVELASRFELKHGEAVAIGLVAEARLAEKLGLAEDRNLSNNIISVLSALGLPYEIPAYLSRPAILQAMRTDKKKDGGVINFALPVNIGKVIVGVGVSDLEEVL